MIPKTFGELADTAVYIVIDYLLSSAPINHPRQGCLTLTTVIPDWLIALLVLTVLACVLLTGLALVIWMQVRRHQGRALVEHAPLDLWTWMAHAVAESNPKRDGEIGIILPKELDTWALGITNGTVARIEKGNDEVQPLTQDNVPRST